MRTQRTVVGIPLTQVRASLSFGGNSSRLIFKGKSLMSKLSRARVFLFYTAFQFLIQTKEITTTNFKGLRF